MSDKRALLQLLPYLKRYQRGLVIGGSLVLLTNLAAVVSPWILGRAIDDLRVNLSRERLLFYALLIVGVSLVEGIFRFGMRRILIGISRWVEFDLRSDLFAHLQRLSQSFYQTHPTGDLMARATNDISAVRSVLGPGIMYSLNTVFSSVLTISVLITIHPPLAAISLIPLALVSVCTRYFGRAIHVRFLRIQEQFSQLSTRVQESISGIRVVKAYNQEPAFRDLFHEDNREYLERSLSLARVSGVFYPLLGVLLGLSGLTVLWYGGAQVIEGKMTLGELVAFMAYLTMLTWPTLALGWVVNIVERGAASMGRIQQLLSTKPQISDVRQGKTAPDFGHPLPDGGLQGHLEVRDLSFSYNGERVLDRVQFSAPAGSTIAIVGHTGSGKSTLAHLLCRLYPVDRNSIFIDGVDINDLPLKALRKKIGFVPQDNFLFSETVRENIAFGRPGAPLSEIEEVAEISDVLHDIRDFPEQFETFVGERGITLSGGQKQRITLSRALLIDPVILILDDALSHLDTHTEERILEGLSSELADRTALVISHRISSVKFADQILVFQKGRVIESGTHDQLLEKGGYYRRLHEMQLLREELELE